MMKSATLLILTLVLTTFAGTSADASGIFTLRGKLKSFTEEKYIIQTRTMIYDIQKSQLTDAQNAEMKTKKTGQEVDLVVTTEAVSNVRDVAP